MSLESYTVNAARSSVVLIELVNEGVRMDVFAKIKSCLIDMGGSPLTTHTFLIGRTADELVQELTLKLSTVLQADDVILITHSPMGSLKSSALTTAKTAGGVIVG
jgi:hypothetical protein